jgi:hypothetical protein
MWTCGSPLRASRQFGGYANMRRGNSICSRISLPGMAVGERTAKSRPHGECRRGRGFLSRIRTEGFVGQQLHPLENSLVALAALSYCVRTRTSLFKTPPHRQATRREVRPIAEEVNMHGNGSTLHVYPPLGQVPALARLPRFGHLVGNRVRAAENSKAI